MRRSFSNIRIPKPSRFRPLETLADDSLDTFRASAFNPQVPALLPRGHFANYPAKQKWFTINDSHASLNHGYLESHGDCNVPLELTSSGSSSQNGNGPMQEFKRFYAPLSLFLKWSQEAASNNNSTSRLYLAQCQLLDLPTALRTDFPSPNFVNHAGKGDIYDTNIWLGVPPTYTPLHKDPNPNLFLQLAGSKHVRLFAPKTGLDIFTRVRETIGRSGGATDAAFRGEDMMHGLERDRLEREVWEENAEDQDGKGNLSEGYEALLNAGDAVFIPMGWWHSLKGVGEGVTASGRHASHVRYETEKARRELNDKDYPMNMFENIENWNVDLILAQQQTTGRLTENSTALEDDPEDESQPSREEDDDREASNECWMKTAAKPRPNWPSQVYYSRKMDCGGRFQRRRLRPVFEVEFVKLLG